RNNRHGRPSVVSSARAVNRGSASARPGLASPFAAQACAQLVRRQPILERLPAVDEQDRNLQAKTRLQIGVAGDVHFLHGVPELPRNRMDDVFHVLTEVALGARVKSQMHSPHAGRIGVARAGCKGSAFWAVPQFDSKSVISFATDRSKMGSSLWKRE